VNETGSHARFEDELAAYMLGALTPPEVDEFERHLEGCAHCQARERWLRASLDVLPASVEQLEPPPALRDRLMDAVRREAGAPQDAAPARPARREPLGARARAWLGAGALRPATALAAVTLLVAAGAIGYALRGGGGSGGASTIAVQASRAVPGATASIVRDGDRGILRVSMLPQRPGRVYEIWLAEGDSAPKPSALFQVHSDGSGAAGIPSGLDRATQVMVTSEPARGSSAPTSLPVLQARI
jgi:anti-sigma-K factor RskA